MMYSLDDVISYVVLRLGKVEGLKKLMKLLFLTQYDLPGRLRRQVVKYLYEDEPVCRGEFYIWSYGPFMNEVYGIIEERFVVDDREPPFIIRPPPGLHPPRLPPEVAERIDRVLERYGDRRGWELEDLINRRLGLIPSRKEEYMGVAVDLYIRRELGPRRLVFRDLKSGMTRIV